MPKFKMSKPSSSASKPQPRGSGGTPEISPSLQPSPFHPFTPAPPLPRSPFALPSGLRNLARIAAVIAAILLPVVAQAGPGSLWKEDSSRSMFADKRARAVGDIITIIVQENNTTSKENSTKTSKSSSVDASLDTLVYPPAISKFLTKGGQLPAMKFGGSQTFDGGGKINNSERITTRIAVRVVDVLPNGNMLIEGRRETLVSGEKQEAILRGIVRSEDVAANNTVFSYNVADASIKFVGKGTISDNIRKGWLHRVWEKVTPF